MNNQVCLFFSASESYIAWQGLGGVRRRQVPVAEDGEHSLNRSPPLHSSTPLPRAGKRDIGTHRAEGKDWRKNFASSPESDCSSNNNGNFSLGGDSGYGGLDSSRLVLVWLTEKILFSELAGACLSPRSLRPGGGHC